MKSAHVWNRREFLAKPAALVAASQILGSSTVLFGEGVESGADTRNSGAPSKTIYRTLGRTKIRLPIVSMGVMNADVPGLVRRSFEMGVRHFDTAAVYQQGRNEEMVGQVIREMGVRDQVVIATKAQARPNFWNRDPGSVGSRMRATFEGSLKRLQMDHVDILYSHGADSAEDIASEGMLRTLTDLKKEGKAHFVGVSSHKPQLALEQAMKLGVYDVVLIPLNYTMADDEGLLRTIDEAAKNGIGIVAMKTQAGGATRPDPKLAKPLTPASQTALLKWVLHHEAITTAIPGYTTYEQLQQNFSVASSLAFTEPERSFLSDRRTVSEAQFCRQCGECVPDCPQGVDIPRLMRSHMYAVQYANYELAAQSMGGIAGGKGLGACGACSVCSAKCRNSVDIAMKIQSLKEIAAIGRVEA